MPDFELEAQAGGIVCGVDEAGRGPWAGPVVAGAVILDIAALSHDLRIGLDDSKKLKAAERQRLFEILKTEATFGVGIAEVGEIDSLNILQATLSAMARAVADLGMIPDLALIDGNKAPALPCPARTVIRGDAKSLSIAAASIVAKVTRDGIMAELGRAHPGYGWDHNAGYGTPEHQAALERLGVTAQHRKSFKPIRKILSQE